MKDTEASLVSQEEWVEGLDAAGGKIRTVFAKGGIGEFLGQRKTIIDLGDGKEVEVLVTRPMGYGDRPETITVRRRRKIGEVEFLFTFVQTRDDLLSNALPAYYSLQDAAGEILSSSRGDEPDFALAVELLGDDYAERRRIETELVEKSGYHVSSHYTFDQRVIEAIKAALSF